MTDNTIIRLMNAVYLMLGSNEGDRLFCISSAREHIKNSIGIITALSAVYETEPWGDEKQAPFLNRALSLVTDKSPDAVLRRIKEIENFLGRQRTGEKWRSRTIDIDILFYGNAVINKKELTIPHPLLHKRNFVLVPLNEIAEDYVHPVLQKTVAQLLRDAADHKRVSVFAQTSCLSVYTSAE